MYTASKLKSNSIELTPSPRTQIWKRSHPSLSFDKELLHPRCGNVSTRATWRSFLRRGTSSSLISVTASDSDDRVRLPRSKHEFCSLQHKPPECACVKDFFHHAGSVREDEACNKNNNTSIKHFAESILKDRTHN